MKAQEKGAVMEAFQKGALSVLVSTTVIEVGVDVPNATLMIIENAERFGLSALHQLRGRIGRGVQQSHCILVSSTTSQNARKRLEFLRKNNNGFELARYDLQSRGPGDFFGKRQHGLPELHIADLAADEDVLHNTSHAAQHILARDPLLEAAEFLALRQQVDAMFKGNGGILN
jgi:ATP-dependent DNA helicase RecG